MTDAKTAIHDTENRVRDGLDTVRETASKVYHDAGDKASEVLEVSREKTKRVVNTLESNPLGLLVGGLAVGAIAGALIPRSAREKELLAPVGKRLSETVVAATAAAKAAGQSELGELGLTKDNARGQARGLLDGIVKALSTAGTAGAKAVSQKPAV
ncbi:hypothetical protein ASF00_11050 [Sphingomonas sp. Leaf34]|uniref:hypothetical protein n=1 Tax=Sphingomonas sp. Leaf34 TaxID=1736216 RepID=UPI0006F5BBA7|nr:hypothetical protein [Sphingomonas sp. Leaf34]KQN28377.1 hypothetical protein ASF00_11050 [Sphingomonas sp. Leaf34]